MDPTLLPSYDDLLWKCDSNNVELVLPESLEPRRLCIVGEALGAEELLKRLYFEGKSGKLLDKLLREVGLIRGALHVTNVIKIQPPSNDLTRLSELGLELDDFIPYLKEELNHVKPRVILAVGRLAMEVLTGKFGITKWRGSVVDCTFVHYDPNPSVVPTLHPAYLQRGQMHLYPYVRHDVKLFAELGFGIHKTHKPFELVVDPTFTNTIEYLDSCIDAADETCFDIETVNNERITCVGFSRSPDSAICIPFRYKGLRNRWQKHESMMILDKIRTLYNKPLCTKIGQNMHYDMHFLLPLLGFPREPLFDTMLAHSLIHPDAKHDLGFIMSIYTDMPFHKDEAKDWRAQHLPHDLTLWEYNAKDVIGTHRAYVNLKRDLIEMNLYNFFAGYIIPFRRVLFEMEWRGIKIDMTERQRLIERVETEELPDILWQIEELTGQALNPNSSLQVGGYLNEVLKIPVRRTEKGNYTVKEDILHELAARYPKHKRIIDKILCARVLKAKDLGTYLTAKVSPDGRMRTSFGTTVTGRLSSRANMFGAGTNLQNQPKKFRKLYVPDNGHVFLEPDLSQAEARVMAWLMKSDKLKSIFRKGQKIHKIMGGEIYGKDPEKLTDDEYLIAKKTVHGSNYDMGERKFATLIQKPVSIAREIRTKYFLIVPELAHYHQRIRETIDTDRKLTTPYGRVRVFTGRLDDETYRSGYAQIPQSTVVDTLNVGTLGLWLIKPTNILILTQNHDSILLSMPPSLVEWFKPYIKVHLETLRELTIEGDLLIIPVDIGEAKNNWLGK